MGERLPAQKSYVCSFFNCKAKFVKSWKLEAHLCKHTGLKPFSCENCDKSFCTRYQLTRHELSHSGEKPHKCEADGCAEAFITTSGLKNHMAHVHQHQEKRYKCDHQGCGKDFNKRNQLKSHAGQHNNNLPFHCSFGGCSREFPSHGKLKHHNKVHIGYPCESEGCPFRAKTWSEYTKHRQGHKVKLPCAKCSKKFNNSWFLHMHQLLRHRGQRRKLACPRRGCSKAFTRRFNLESHVLGDHDGKKNFSCAFAGCGRSFAMKESLWRHGVVHDPMKKKRKKLRPKKQQSATQKVNQADATKLAAKLRRTTLKDNKP